MTLTFHRAEIPGEGSSVVSYHQLGEIHVIPGKVPLDATPVPAHVLLGQAGHSDNELVSSVPQGHAVRTAGCEGDHVAIAPEIASAPLFGGVLIVGMVVADSRLHVRREAFLNLAVHDHGFCQTHARIHHQSFTHIAAPVFLGEKIKALEADFFFCLFGVDNCYGLRGIPLKFTC